ncbi:MAG TPA: aquaporin [Anaerolineae bacterium]
MVGIAFAHGLTLMIMVYALGAISGAHVNPAVTLGLALGSKIKWNTAVVYWIAQLVGTAIAGFAVLLIFRPVRQNWFPRHADTGSRRIVP